MSRQSSLGLAVVVFGWYISVEGLCHYIVYNFRQECDPDTNFRDIDFRKNLMKALVETETETES